MFNKHDQDHILKQVGNCWFKLERKNIFISGGTGFIGKWLIGSLILANKIYSLNCKVAILTRNSQVFRNSYDYIANDPAVSFIDNDIRFLTHDSKEYDFVIHAATDVSLSNSPIDTFDVCSIGTRSILDFAIKSKASNFLLLSSGAVYGKQPPELNSIDELYNGIPDRISEKSAYGLGKICSEWMTSEYNRKYGLNTKIARCFSFVGPYLPMDKHFAIGNFIKDAITGGSIVINGDGTPIRTYLYSADLAVWLWRILLDGDKGDVFNVGGDRQISIEQLATLIKDLVNPKAKIIVGNKNVKNIFPERYVPDINLAQKKLGLFPIISLDKSIENTTKWFLNKDEK